MKIEWTCEIYIAQKINKFSSTSEPLKVVFFFIENVNGGDEGLVNLRWNIFTFTKLSIKYLSRKWCVNNKKPQIIIYIYL